MGINASQLGLKLSSPLRILFNEQCSSKSSEVKGSDKKKDFSEALIFFQIEC